MPNVALRGVPEPVHRRLKDAARANDAGAAPRSAGAPMPVVAIPYEPLSEEELLERARKRRAEIDARGGIDLSPETIEALIQEGRRR